MSRMSNLARQEMYFEHFFGVDEIMEKVDAVTSEEVMVMANSLFDPDKVAVTLLGRLDGLKISRAQLAC
jgi:predicted Zn-dependent peptidase